MSYPFGHCIRWDTDKEMSDPYTDQAKVLAAVSAENGVLRTENERLKRAEIAWHLAEAEIERLTGQTTEAAAFLDRLAGRLDAYDSERNMRVYCAHIGEDALTAATDCRAMAAKLREGK